jgi:hypothetical protein
MTRIAHNTETREEAYRTWKASGQNVDRALKELKKGGFVLCRETLSAWRDRYAWKERAAGAEAREGKQKDGNADDTIRLIADLESQKARYERFFQSLDETGIDNQATYAYTGLVKAIADIRKKAAERPDLYAMAPLVMDEFVRFIKARTPPGSEAAEEARAREIVFDLIDGFFEELRPDGV